MVIQMLEMKLVGKCEELECCIIVYRPFQQFMRIKAQKPSVNKVPFENQPVSARQTQWFWFGTVLCCISFCSLIFFNISELFPVVLHPDLLHRFYQFKLVKLSSFFFPPSPGLFYHLMMKLTDYLTITLVWKTIVLSFL